MEYIVCSRTVLVTLSSWQRFSKKLLTAPPPLVLPHPLSSPPPGGGGCLHDLFRVTRLLHGTLGGEGTVTWGMFPGGARIPLCAMQGGEGLVRCTMISVYANSSIEYRFAARRRLTFVRWGFRDFWAKTSFALPRGLVGTKSGRVRHA